VRKQVLRSGDGATLPATGDTLVMHYTGMLATTGEKFDSSVDREEPFEFKIGVGQVIKGWDEGVILMSLGEKAVLHVRRAYRRFTIFFFQKPCLRADIQ
jgi:FK506-binding protein 1